MGRERVATYVLPFVTALVAVAGVAGEVAFDDIRGARRAEGHAWHLALGGPVDGGVITKRSDVTLQPGTPAPLIDVPAFLSGREFTVLLELSDVKGGILRIRSPKAPADVRAVMVSQGGWQAVRYGPVDWEGELPLTVQATAPMRIGHVTVCRSFAQLYGMHGQVDLIGAAYHKLAPGDEEVLSYPLLPAGYREPRTGRWRRPPVVRRDGLWCANLDKHYQSFLNGPLSAESGLAVPVRAPNGVVLCARMRGQFAFVVYPEIAKYMLIREGKADAWSAPALHLDGSVLDGDGNRILTGKKKLDWATARTWIDNYGTGLLDYVVVLPQNEIRVAGQRRLVLQYESAAGLKPLSLELPMGTEGVALVNAGPSLTEVLLRSEDKYESVARVEDSRCVDRLVVKAGSVRLDK